ncbi:hypothetical protein [Paenibacillus sp. FSL R7-0179]|uniref:hypothetical protein n=1 Tax=Paenibacillus sp. FSL R7-0179 TaxID=2921672 RepID=UPI0030F56445
MTNTKLDRLRTYFSKYSLLSLILLTAVLLLTACSDKSPSDSKQVKVVRNFIADIMTYNQDHDIDLSQRAVNSDQFWFYAEQAGLTKQLSSSYLNPNSFNKAYTEGSKVEENLLDYFRPMINYLEGYTMDDLVITYNEEMEVITVSIKPDRVEKGIYFLDDPKTLLFFTFYVDKVKEDGIKIISMACVQPKAVINRYEWYTKDALQELKELAGVIPSSSSGSSDKLAITPSPSSVSEITPTEPPQNEMLNENPADFDEPVEGDAPETESLIRSTTGNSLVDIEWIPGNPDVTIPIRFGTTDAELILGQDHPNGVKALVVYTADSFGWPLDLSSTNQSGAFDDFGDLQEGYRLQASVYDFDNDGTNELVVATGDLLIDAEVWVFSFTKVDDTTKINPLKQELASTGQSYFTLDGHDLYAPYGSQGLFEVYKYVDKAFVTPAN